ncbi:hypothetical protein BH09PSE5_BH09PSE5_33140 [soil metagenome]
MHRSRRDEANSHPSRDERDPVGTDGSAAGAGATTIFDVQRYATQALHVTPRIVARGQSVDVVTRVRGGHAVYRVRAVASGDALVIQHRERADISPFSGLLVTKAGLGMPPRVLYDMEPLVEGSLEVAEACRMLDALVQHASAR